MNQCDGCGRGLPVRQGKHGLYHELTGVGSYPGEQMGCTAHLYPLERGKSRVIKEGKWWKFEHAFADGSGRFFSEGKETAAEAYLSMCNHDFARRKDS